MYSCAGTKDPSATELREYEDLKSLVSARNFKIVNDFANTSIGGNVNIVGNTNFIEFKGDSVDVFLPFFGIRYSGSSYGNEGGIKYKGIAKDLKITEQTDKARLLLEFRGSQNGEDLDFIITLFPNKNVNTSVNTSERSTISFRGEISEIKSEEDF
ncbi:hypothetical protein GCM10011532_31840 [Christiangramia forsetii]|nr:hypothetical protein GCM10011532_31840 [Christiangramia forsetii]